MSAKPTTIVSDMAEDDDIGALSEIEAAFYKSGYTSGYEHGRVHGVFDGRALGQEKGFEVWEELGYYQGTAAVWQRVLEIKDEQASTSSKKKASQHIEQLLGLIAAFPSSLADHGEGGKHSEQDIEQMLQSIRSKYRVTCASLGIRPRLQKAAMSL